MGNKIITEEPIGTAFWDEKRSNNQLELKDYKNRYISEELKRFCIMKNIEKKTLEERSGYSKDDLKNYWRDPFTTNGNTGYKSVAHIPTNVVFALAISLELGLSEFNALLDSAGYAPLKSYRTWRGDNLILDAYEEIEEAFSENDTEEAEILIRNLNKKFEEINQKQPFKR